MLNKSFLQEITKRLLQEKQEITDRVSCRTDIDTDGDETDEIQANMLIEIQNHLSHRDSIKLLQINDALNKINEQTYGACNDCGEDILEKRLSINPYFTLCVSCAEDQENEIKQRKRF